MAYTTETAAKQESLLSVIRDFDPQLQRLFKVAQHLMIIADRIEGSRPQEAGSPVVDHPPHSTINELQRKRETLSMACGQLEMEAQRIDNAFGGHDKLAGANKIG